MSSLHKAGRSVFTLPQIHQPFIRPCTCWTSGQKPHKALRDLGVEHDKHPAVDTAPSLRSSLFNTFNNCIFICIWIYIPARTLWEGTDKEHSEQFSMAECLYYKVAYMATAVVGCAFHVTPWRGRDCQTAPPTTPQHSLNVG